MSTTLQVAAWDTLLVAAGVGLVLVGMALATRRRRIRKVREGSDPAAPPVATDIAGFEETVAGFGPTEPVALIGVVGPSGWDDNAALPADPSELARLWSGNVAEPGEDSYETAVRRRHVALVWPQLAAELDKLDPTP